MASTYLNRNASATATTFTYSVWLKRSDLGSDYQYFFSYQSSGGGSNGYGLAFNGSTNKMYYYGTGGTATTDAVFRDPSAWYHVVLSVTSGTGTLYVNNETVKSSISVNQVTSGEGMTIGAYKYGSTIDYQFDGYMAHAHFTDGYAYTPSTFGSTATNGQWVPNLNPSVTYGSNGFFLKFTNASNLGEDFSGNDNDFTKTGSGDKIIDCPANVFATMNPLNTSASMLLKQGNLKAEANGNDQAAAATLGITSGKWYFEFYYPAGDNPELGLMPVTKSPANQSSSASTSLDATAFITNNGGMRTGAWSSTSTTGLSSQTSESIIGVAVDANAGKMWFTNGSGTYFNSGNPATGANAQATFDSDWLSQTGGVLPYTIVATGAGNYATANFGQDSSFGGAKTAQNNADGNGEGEFYYAVPSGYLALCTKNLSSALTLPIGKGSSYFNTLTWSGNDATRNITGVGFQPGFVWVKSRSDDAGHVLFDSSRGASKRLVSNAQAGETTTNEYGFVTAFGSDGFTLTPGNQGGYASGDTNMSGRTYVGWNWKANGGTTSSNSDGTITSTVQASTTSGFSVVTWTGNNTSGATVGHGLGKQVDMIITKRVDAVSDWNTWHNALTGTQILALNKNIAATNDAGTFPDATGMNSTVFKIGNGSWINGSSSSLIAYCFASIEGFSKINKYTGNGNANGPFVYTGFRPSFILMKSSTSAENWLIYDDVRDPHNVTDEALLPNLSSASGGSSNAMDLCSNGFKLRSSSGSLNNSGQTYAYMAFAKNPFVDSSGIPVTAR